MPVKGTKEYNWKNTQLSSGPAGLDAKIEKEIEVNEGGTLWRDKKARLLEHCTKKRVMPSRDGWEENCTNF
jgi:hypothetical protein